VRWKVNDKLIKALIITTPPAAPGRRRLLNPQLHQTLHELIGLICMVMIEGVDLSPNYVL